MNTSDVADHLRVRDLLDLAFEVCKRRGVTLDEVCGRARSKAISRARQEVWWRIRHHPERQYSYPEIARLFARDHTTIMAGISAHERRASVALP
ncbi:MAG TPA: helix-turn-helix domain-containing protein [Thermoleophilaceae bacterium]|jgi:chromosomal replication initiation ATPase DnaA|nr:helix-turn-helix domain-containing protein [Thermoleophilaceae bacterium]